MPLPKNLQNGTLSPTRIAQASRCLHAYALDLFGDFSKRRPDSVGQVEERERGVEFERSVVSSLSGVQRPQWDGKDMRAGAKATVTLMRKGPRWIAGGALMTKAFAGLPDLLERKAVPSALGDFSYRPVEIKNHKKLQARDSLQVCTYAKMLEEAINSPCPSAGVWLNSGDVQEVEVSDIEPSWERLVALMNEVRAGGRDTEAIWCSACPQCAWLGVCKDFWNDSDHLSLLPGGGRGVVDKLYEAGIRTVSQVASSEPKALAEQAKLTEKTATGLWRHATARVQGKPLVIQKPQFPEGVPVHFYDIETYGGEVFLHGVIRVFEEERVERFFYADKLDDAADVWHQFLDFVGKDKEAVIYCWADYEIGHAEVCWEKFGGNKRAYEMLMSSLVDQCKWTKEYFAFPTRDYSIKEIAPSLGFRWKAVDAGGLNCEAWYGEWLKSGSSQLKEKILEYNRDDVLAMEVIFNYLKEV